MNGTAKNSTDTSMDTMSRGRHSTASAVHSRRPAELLTSNTVLVIDGKVEQHPCMTQAVSCYGVAVSDEAGAVPHELPRYLQLIWDREVPGRRGPKPGRTIWEIGAAGAEVADTHGLDAVSMKSVAAALGLTPMSLYRYVDSKDELLAVMLDVAYGPVPDQAALRSGQWRARLTAWGHALAGALLAHPWISQALPRVPPTTPNILAWTDAGVAAFGDLPLDGQEKLSALLVLDGYVRSHVQQSVTLGAVGPGASPGADEPPVDNEYTRRLAALVDPARLPHLARAALDAFDDEDDDFYETELAFGLELILDGIESLAATPPAQRRRASRS